MVISSCKLFAGFMESCGKKNPFNDPPLTTQSEEREYIV